MLVKRLAEQSTWGDRDVVEELFIENTFSLQAIGIYSELSDYLTGVLLIIYPLKPATMGHSCKDPTNLESFF